MESSSVAFQQRKAGSAQGQPSIPAGWAPETLPVYLVLSAGRGSPVLRAEELRQRLSWQSTWVAKDLGRASQTGPALSRDPSARWHNRGGT